MALLPCKLSPVVVVVVLMLGLTTWEATAQDTDLTDDAWNSFKQRFGKKYRDSSEERLRRGIREINIRSIKAHNEEAKSGRRTFTLKENRFSDMTPDEYKRFLGYRNDQQLITSQRGNGRRRRRQVYAPSMPVYTNTISVSTLPTSVNWTQTGWVGPVMDQGMCGSCWAYSAVGAIVAQYKNRTGTLSQLSEQNLIDCSSAQGNLGCDGGNQELAFWYVQTNGIESLANYPDVSNGTGVANPTCSFNSALSVTKVASWRSIISANELALQQALAKVGPVSASVNAGLDSFQFYAGGVYSDTACTGTIDDLNHAVLVVGYGVSGSQPFWLVKNSWSTDWGINGYMLLARNANNMCGIATDASFPVIA